MPYNVDTIEVVRGRFRFLHLAEIDPDDLPEVNFLDQDQDEYSAGDDLWWSGEGSGSAFDALLGLLEDTEGDADLVVCWEGGDSYTGLRVKGGTVTRHKVVMTLGDEEESP